MKLELLKSAIVSVLVFAPFSALADSGLLQSEDKLSCEKLQQYYPVVKSQLTFASKASKDAQSRVEKLKQQLSGHSKDLLAELSTVSTHIRSLMTSLTRISADKAASQKIIAELSKKEVLSAEDKIALSKAQAALSKAETAFEWQSKNLKIYKASSMKLNKALRDQNDDVLEAIRSVQRQASHFLGVANLSERERSRVMAEMEQICK